MKAILTAVALMSMSGGAYGAEFSDLAVKAAGLQALAAAENIAVPDIPKGYVEPAATPIEWVSIGGGRFMMGTTSFEDGFEDAKPIHEVAIIWIKVTQDLIATN